MVLLNKSTITVIGLLVLAFWLESYNKFLSELVFVILYLLFLGSFIHRVYEFIIHKGQIRSRYNNELMSFSDDNFEYIIVLFKSIVLFILLIPFTFMFISWIGGLFS